MPRTVLAVVGARPNFMKIAPLLAVFRERPEAFDPILVHTGQHYDAALSTVFFEQLGIGEPDIHLGVGSGTHAQQTAAVMRDLEPILTARRPDLVVVVGDVNSTLAAALVAAEHRVPIAHVEAGLRSFDRSMPEETNRVATDLLASYLFATEVDAVRNLEREGIESDRVYLVGNVMIDTLLRILPIIRARRYADTLGLDPQRYVVATLHRPSNVDDPAQLRELIGLLARVGAQLPVVFAVHPRTAARLSEPELARDLRRSEVRLVEPLPYVEFMSLVSEARLVLTDSGGIQEETTVLGVPCVTLRDSTERPVTVELGTNRLAGTDARAAFELIDGVLAVPPDGSAQRRVPPLWDGRAAVRIADVLEGEAWTLRQSRPIAA